MRTISTEGRTAKIRINGSGGNLDPQFGQLVIYLFTCSSQVYVPQKPLIQFTEPTKPLRLKWQPNHPADSF